MKPSEELFKLIKTLTKSEKRFFKLFSSLQAGEKNYFKLFDYIEKQDSYDEEKLKNHFKGETFIKHLPSEKNHLYKQILKSLRQFHGEQSISSILNQEIKNIEILYSKSLVKEAFKFLKRAKKLAQQHEEFYFLIDLYSWEKVLISASYESGNFDVNLNQIIKEEAETITKLQNLSEYYVLYSRINAVFRSEGYSLDKEQKKVVDEIANHPLIIGKNTALSARAASICYYIQGLCAATLRDFKVSYVKFNRVKEILDKNPKIKADLNERYILSLFHLKQCYAYEKNFTEAHEILKQIKKLQKDKAFRSLHMKILLGNILLTDKITLYNKQGKFEKAIQIFTSKEKDNLELINNSNKEQKIKFYFTIAYAYFGVKDYKTSLQYINLILNDNEQQLRQDIYSFSRILNLLIHFELENYEHIEYSANSALSYLSKTKRKQEVEELFIKYLKRIAREVLPEAQKTLFRESINEVSKSVKTQEDTPVLDYIHLLDWLESKCHTTDLEETIKQRLSKI